MSLDPGDAFALDVNSVTRLKYSRHAGSAKQLKQVSQQFEAMFIQKMLKSMRDAIPKSGLLQSSQGDTYQQMMDAQWSQTLAKRGIGLADMLTHQLVSRGEVKTDSAAASDKDPLAGIAHADPRPLAASVPVAALNAKSAPASTAKTRRATPLVPAASGAPLFALSAANTAPSGNAADSGERPDYVARFVKRMGPAADSAARKTGLPRQLILAQAALESGWGRHEIPRADGASSYNVFNIKATGWHGQSAQATTTEFNGGAPHSTRAGFRVYGSYDQAFSDYARLLSQSPRYAPVLKATTAQAAAQALQDCGYASDPAYADKLVAIMKQIPADTGQTPSPLFDNNAAQPLVDVATMDDKSAADAHKAGGLMPVG